VGVLTAKRCRITEKKVSARSIMKRVIYRKKRASISPRGAITGFTKNQEQKNFASKRMIRSNRKAKLQKT